MKWRATFGVDEEGRSREGYKMETARNAFEFSRRFAAPSFAFLLDRQKVPAKHI